jgi:hypothetical protein
MGGAIHPFPQYAFMAWYSAKKTAKGQLYLYILPYPTSNDVNNLNEI